MLGVEDKRFVYEVNGNKIIKEIRFLNVRFDFYNFIVEFYRLVFFVLFILVFKCVFKRVKFIFKFDKIDNVNEEWIDLDVFIFNIGYWWIKIKFFET